MENASHPFDLKAPATGVDLVTQSFNGIPGRCDRYLLAKSVVEGRSQEELIEYRKNAFGNRNHEAEGDEGPVAGLTK